MTTHVKVGYIRASKKNTSSVYTKSSAIHGLPTPRDRFIFAIGYSSSRACIVLGRRAGTIYLIKWTFYVDSDRSSETLPIYIFTELVGNHNMNTYLQSAVRSRPWTHIKKNSKYFKSELMDVNRKINRIQQRKKRCLNFFMIKNK